MLFATNRFTFEKFPPPPQFAEGPYESCKIFKGRARRNAFSKLVHRQYKSFRSDRFCQIEIKNPTRLSNKTNNAWSRAEDQILENKISGT